MLDDEGDPWDWEPIELTYEELTGGEMDGQDVEALDTFVVNASSRPVEAAAAAVNVMSEASLGLLEQQTPSRRRRRSRRRRPGHSKPGPSFVTGHEGLMAALSAKEWATRPSALLAITDPQLAYLVDDALALRLRLESGRGGQRSRHEPPAGQRFATDGDFDDSDWSGPVEERWPVH